MRERRQQRARTLRRLRAISRRRTVTTTAATAAGTTTVTTTVTTTTADTAAGTTDRDADLVIRRKDQPGDSSLLADRLRGRAQRRSGRRGRTSVGGAVRLDVAPVSAHGPTRTRPGAAARPLGVEATAARTTGGAPASSRASAAGTQRSAGGHDVVDHEHPLVANVGAGHERRTGETTVVAEAGLRSGAGPPVRAGGATAAPIWRVTWRATSSA